MPALNFDQIKTILGKFIPTAYLDNPFVKALLGGAAAVGILLATPAFAPVGVVGATGWIIVYIVTGGTFSMDLFKRAWDAWREMGAERQREIDAELKRLKEARDNEALTDEEYRKRVQEILDGAIRKKTKAGKKAE